MTALRQSLVRLVPAYIRVMNGAHRFLRKGEPELRLLPALCRRDALSIDVGANRGVYTYFLTRYSGSVLALDPNPMFASLLRRAFGKTVTVMVAAASDCEGEATLRIPMDSGISGMATIEPENALLNCRVETMNVPLIRLDSLKLSKVGFIKIDVEGHELSVLRGAEEILHRDGPNLIIEAEERHRPDAVGSIHSFLKSFDYRGFYLLNGRMEPIETFDPVRDQSCNELAGEPSRPYIYNFIFVKNGDRNTLDALVALAGKSLVATH